MESLPENPMPLTHLQTFDLAYNNLSSIDPVSIERLSQLRHLSLAGNKFTHLPASCWRYLSFLKTLDVSFNPTRVLTKESFVGLERIQELTIQNLPDLKRFDADSLAQLTYLKKLNIQVNNLTFIIRKINCKKYIIYILLIFNVMYHLYIQFLYRAGHPLKNINSVWDLLFLVWRLSEHYQPKF